MGMTANLGVSPSLANQGTSTRRKRKGVHLQREDETLTQLKRRKVVDDKETEDLSEPEKKLVNTLNLKPSTFKEMKDNISKQLYAYGMCNRGRSGQEILKYVVKEDHTFTPSYSWAQHIELPYDPLG